MLVTRRAVCQDGGCRELVRFVLVVDHLLPPSDLRIGNVGWLIRAWEWRSSEDEGLGKEAEEDGVHGILPLQEVTLVEKLIVGIFYQVPYQISSGRYGEILQRVRTHSFRL